MHFIRLTLSSKTLHGIEVLVNVARITFVLPIKDSMHYADGSCICFDDASSDEQGLFVLQSFEEIMALIPCNAH